MANATWPRNGFTLAKRTDTNEQYTDNFPAQASTNQPIAIGDAVAYLNGVMVPATAGMDPTQPGYGIVLNVYTTANRPFTEQTVKIIASGQPGRVDVLYDPNAEFIVRCEASVGLADLGKNFMLVTSGATATLGRSGSSVTIQSSASPDNLFRGVKYAPQNSIYGSNGQNDQGTAGGAGQPIVVRWNRHAFKAGTAGT